MTLPESGTATTGNTDGPQTFSETFEDSGPESLCTDP
jgi:hypothetical protein